MNAQIEELRLLMSRHEQRIRFLEEQLTMFVNVIAKTNIKSPHEADHD